MKFVETSLKHLVIPNSIAPYKWDKKNHSSSYYKPILLLKLIISILKGFSRDDGMSFQTPNVTNGSSRIQTLKYFDRKISTQFLLEKDYFKTKN